MAYEDILFDVADGVAKITLNRPEALNGLTRQMRGELIHAIKRGADEARALLITGEGAAFCAGEDFGGGRHAADVDFERLVRDELGPLLQVMQSSEAPIVCAVNGAAAGTAANFALACDVVVAARSATFEQSLTNIGLMPDMAGAYFSPRMIGLPRALGMAFFAEPISAPQAAEWGMIWEVVDDAGLTARASELALRLAKGPTKAYAAMRRAMRRSLSISLEEHLVDEAMLQGELGQTRDFAEGITAFIERRDPEFEGR